MEIQLIQGQFSTQDAIDILTQMINVKIKFQESKIAGSEGEEAIKMREQRIKDLQQQLRAAREHILTNGKPTSLQSVIQII